MAQLQCTPGQVAVTFYTDVTAGTTTSQNARTTSVTLAAIFGFGMIGLFFRRKTFEKGRLLLMVFLMIVGGALAVSITACNTTTLAPAGVAEYACWNLCGDDHGGRNGRVVCLRARRRRRQLHRPRERIDNK